MKINPINIELKGCKMKVMLTDVSKFEFFYPEKTGYHCIGYSMNNIIDITENERILKDPVTRAIIRTLTTLRIEKNIGGLSINIKKYESEEPFEDMVPSLILKAYEKFYELDLHN